MPRRGNADGCVAFASSKSGRGQRVMPSKGCRMLRATYTRTTMASWIRLARGKSLQRHPRKHISPLQQSYS
ncbi:hypothetical protein FOQG_18852 [Fusarium oxysporum f. sp. raphani 54005]|uniref:Uncharacterized protein n=1 Tax=Fusarium oxysporum f. sp. raphani 54005 TaxID=1089458 RepID=X0BC53_FUSOX|nr:hypothetical protein FOQG_18852 [Fusarium oxysporum f. sp. raphani 54005]